MSAHAEMSSKALRSEAKDQYKKMAVSRQKNAMPEVFIDDLYSNASSEDIQFYHPEDLVALAEHAWQRLQTTHPPAIHLTEYHVHGIDQKHARTITCVDIQNENMPFLLASILEQLIALGIDLCFIVHPVFTLSRDSKNTLKDFLGLALPTTGDWRRESYVQVHIEGTLNDDLKQTVLDELTLTLTHLRMAVQDWQPMTKRLAQVLEQYESHPPETLLEEIPEAISFMRWLLANNFTFLGVREYQVFQVNQSYALEALPARTLGIFRDPQLQLLRRGTQWVDVTPKFLNFFHQSVPLIVTKASVRARVKRRVHFDCIGIKLCDTAGTLVGELRIVGLFNASTYIDSIKSIPYLRRKTALITEKIGYESNSHSGKSLVNVLENYPRDELFQADVPVLTEHAQAILHLKNRPRIRVLRRHDKFDRFVSLLVFVPRDRFNTEKRTAIGEFLRRAYGGSLSAVHSSFPERSLARTHFIIGLNDAQSTAPSKQELETGISVLVRNWQDSLVATLYDNYNLSDARTLIKKYAKAFTPAFEQTYHAANLLPDIQACEAVNQDRPLIVSFYWRDDAEVQQAALKFYYLNDAAINLSSKVPLLENLGFVVVNERSYPIKTFDDESQRARVIWLHDLVVDCHLDRAEQVAQLASKLESAVLAVWHGQAANDGYNALIIHTALDWRAVVVMRAIARYLRQTGSQFSEDYMWRTLLKHPAITELIYALFHQKFAPESASTLEDRTHACDAIHQRIESLLEAVSNLNEDRILHAFTHVIQATVRTNAFQQQAHQASPIISFKLASQKLELLPQPRPLYEIYVYSLRFEAIHLRFGKVARGGLRWSDRPQDFRTEVLGLVKAQQVKNAVIVPVGAKGGFVPNYLPVDQGREAVVNEAIDCYRAFITALLSITDNYALNGTVIAPDQVVRWDDDDPYLVVAADKGTASFSDIANTISLERNFWLGDAFASGGSSGYDHKKMAITARGAWEAVKRHFREMNHDIQNQPFSVIGVGDMSGDVFGNSMLLSPHTRLLAAFDHRDIFIDPDPDITSAFAERQRLFALTRSSWQDYNKSLLSQGGGVFSRSLKAIKLSPQIKQLFGLTQNTLTPDALIKALLQCPADLLWFGGIGTYVRASTESNEAIGDKTNDNIRIDAPALRVKVIGEGANLGASQRARVEFAQLGGRVNSDAIDNAGGVNSSDLEVNVKILLDTVMRDGQLTLIERNALLVAMTPRIAELVLQNNYDQTLAISLVEWAINEDFDHLVRHLTGLERSGQLDRSLEYLPTDPVLNTRKLRKQWFYRPEIAVLVSYAKLVLFDQILASALIDDPYLLQDLAAYFPAVLAEKYPAALADHRLRREIISTKITNEMINRGGPAFIRLLQDETESNADNIAKAYVVARDCFALDGLYQTLSTLDNVVAAEHQLAAYQQLRLLIIDISSWYVGSTLSALDLTTTIAHLSPAVKTLQHHLSELLPSQARAEYQQAQQHYRALGFGEGRLSNELAGQNYMVYAPDIFVLANSTTVDLLKVAKIYFQVTELFNLQQILEAIKNLTLEEYYDRLMLARSKGHLLAAQQTIVNELLAHGAENWDSWLQTNSQKIAKIQLVIADILNSSPFSLSKFFLVANLLADFGSDNNTVKP